jgi:hypothetical protein
MPTNKKKPSKKSSSKKAAAVLSPAVEGPPVHTEATATLLAFANPADEKDPVARGCVAGGLEVIGISGPFQPGFEIDFDAIDEDSCNDLANFIEICVDEKGFKVPALSGAFKLMHEQGTVITFANLVKAIAKLMTPK